MSRERFSGTAARTYAVLALGLAAAVSGCATTFGGGSGKEPPARIWTPDDGWQVVSSAESSPSALAIRDEARKAFEAGSHADALEGLRAMQEDFPDSAEAEDGETYFLIAECYLNLGEYEDAYKSYEQVLKRRASRDLINRSLNRIYHVGLFFLQGKARRSFAGLPYTSPSFGVEILIGEKGIVTRYPNLEFADEALLEVGRHYFEKKQYPEAEKVYERLVRNYPRREWTELAEYQLAVTVYRQVRGVEYDQGPLKKAKRLFNVYRNHYPRGVHVEKVREFLDEIAEMEAQHDLQVAKYYLRESRPEAAMYYLREVLLNNPKTDAAREAREMYRQMAEYRGLETGEAPAEEAQSSS